MKIEFELSSGDWKATVNGQPQDLTWENALWVDDGEYLYKIDIVYCGQLKKELNENRLG